ncbi:IclR family transcriptional regulator [Caproiciproducens sp. NJN-50]|uniref:IclR family transcriptional regulator n=1 Tax=Acutalibacteraceae TaxID=3082771 RepID=UPI000FFE243A|nr:IclR family transcriptional regulator [Caproicibacter sp. BJN0012]QAT50073.1 IclR family transcriptional regulator [Caproiciproducens sp. NJN-50]
MAREKVSSILRALQVLECFMDNKTEWTLKALVDTLHMPTTTVFRQISTLMERQYLEQDPVRKSYHVGPRLLLLSSAILGQSDLRSIARPELERLSATVEETINLSILLGHDIVYLDIVETHRSVACTTKIGSREPAYASSSGKVMLAAQSEEYLNEYYDWITAVKPMTPKTITDPNQLREQLIRAKLDGYAMDNGEIEAGLMCFGAPVYGLDQKVIAAVSIAGPNYRMKKEREMMIAEVKKTAGRISCLLGYCP